MLHLIEKDPEIKWNRECSASIRLLGREPLFNRASMRLQNKFQLSNFISCKHAGFKWKLQVWPGLFYQQKRPESQMLIRGHTHSVSVWTLHNTHSTQYDTTQCHYLQGQKTDGRVTSYLVRFSNYKSGLGNLTRSYSP